MLRHNLVTKSRSFYGCSNNEFPTEFRDLRNIFYLFVCYLECLVALEADSCLLCLLARLQDQEEGIVEHQGDGQRQRAHVYHLQGLIDRLQYRTWSLQQNKFMNS